MDISKALEGIERLFLEILGYLLPGVVLLLLVFAFVDFKEISVQLKFEEHTWLLVAACYVSGYVIYGVTLVKDRIYEKHILKFTNWIAKKILKRKDEKISNKLNIEKRISKTFAYETSKLILVKLLKDVVGGDVQEKINGLDLNDTRSLAMSYAPESDRKIYTFMFRADLSNLVSTVSLLFGAWGIFACAVAEILDKTLLLRTDEYYWLYYLLLVVMSRFLQNTRMRFLYIALSISFPILIAKIYEPKEKRRSD